MNIRKYIRKNIYRWHRITSLVIAVPVILWTLSGFLHPVMSVFKPNVRSGSLPSVTLDTTDIDVSLKQALLQNHISKINGFRIVQLYKNLYYQVSEPDSDSLTYLSCLDGSVLPDGDKMYAAYLAVQYLTEQPPAADHHNQHAPHSSMVIHAVHVTPPPADIEDSKSRIKSITLLTSFNKEYKRSNVLLPVYRVCFSRGDGLRLFVETSTDRLAYAADSKRVWFTNFFSITHSWSFLDSWGNWKSLLLGSFSALCFLSSVFGFYIYNLTSKKKPTTVRAVHRNRSWHRTTGNFFLVTTLLFSFSGAWHSFKKINSRKPDKSLFYRPAMNSQEMDFSLPTVMHTLKPGEKLSGISVKKMEDRNFLQILVKGDKAESKRYLDLETLNTLPDGDLRYGSWLASGFAGRKDVSVVSARHVNRFNHDYNMMYKRLPVVQVAIGGNERYYVETSTGYLSAITSSSSRAERFSFSNLHMHHFWKMWLGKTIGDPVRMVVLILSTAGLLILAMTGIFMYVKKIRRQRTAA
jgi:hypothetical protein